MHVEITRNPGLFGTPVDDVDHDQFQLDLISCSHQLLLRVTPDHQQLCGDSDLTSEHQYMADPESSKSSTEGAQEYELDFDHQQHDRADVTLNSVDQFGAAGNSTLLLQLANPSLAAASAHELQLDQTNLNLVEQSFFPAASDPLLHDTKNPDHDDDTHHNTRLQTPELHANDDQQLLVCELKAAAAASSKGQLTVRLSNSAGPVAAATATIDSSSFEVDPGSEQSHDHLHVINNIRYHQQQMMIHEHRATRDHNDDDDDNNNNNNKCRRPMMFNTTMHEYCSSSSLQQDQYQDLSRRLAAAAGGGSKRKLAETGFNMSETAEWLQLSLGSNPAATTAAAVAAAKMGCTTVLQGSDQAAFDQSKLAFKTRTGSTPTSSTTSQQLLNGLTGPPIQLDHHHHHISSDQICPLSTNLSFGHAVSSSNNNTGSAFSNTSAATLRPALVLATKHCDLGVVGGGGGGAAAAGGPVPRDWSGILPHQQQYDPQSVIPMTVRFPRYFDEGGFLDHASPSAKQQNLSPMQQSTKTASSVMRTDLLNAELMQGLDMQPSASPSIVHMIPELTGRQQQVPFFECLSGNQMISSPADPSTSTTSLISWPFPEREDMTRVSKKPSQWVKQSASDFALRKESQNLESETQLQYMEGMPAHLSGFSPSQFNYLESERLESTANWKEIKFRVLGGDGHPAAQPAGHTTVLRPKLGVPSCLPESSPQDLGQSQLIHMQPPDRWRGRLGWPSNEASWTSKNLAGCMDVGPTGNGVSGGLGRSVDSWQKLLKSVQGPNVPRCQPPAILSQDATHISALNEVLQEPPSHLSNEWIHRNEFNGELVVRSSPFGSNCGLWFTLQAAPNQIGFRGPPRAIDDHLKQENQLTIERRDTLENCFQTGLPEIENDSIFTMVRKGKFEGADSIEFLFKYAEDMSKVVGVGLRGSKVVVTKQFGVVVMHIGEHLWSDLCNETSFSPMRIPIPKPPPKLSICNLTAEQSSKSFGVGLVGSRLENSCVYVEDNQKQTGEMFPFIFELAKKMGLNENAKNSNFQHPSGISSEVVEGEKNDHWGLLLETMEGGAESDQGGTSSEPMDPMEVGESSQGGNSGEAMEGVESGQGGPSSGPMEVGGQRDQQSSDFQLCFESLQAKGPQDSNENKSLIVTVIPEAGGTFYEGLSNQQVQPDRRIRGATISTWLMFKFEILGGERKITTTTKTKCDLGGGQLRLHEDWNLGYCHDNITISLTCLDPQAVRVSPGTVVAIDVMKRTMTETSTGSTSRANQVSSQASAQVQIPMVPMGIQAQGTLGVTNTFADSCALTVTTKSSNTQFAGFDVNEIGCVGSLAFNFVYPEEIVDVMDRGQRQFMHAGISKTLSPSISGEWIPLNSEEACSYTFKIDQNIYSIGSVKRSIEREKPILFMQQRYEVPFLINHAMSHIHYHEDTKLQGPGRQSLDKVLTKCPEI